MKVEIERLIHISLDKKEYELLQEAYGLLRELYENLDEDLEIGNKAYDAYELIDAILDEVTVND